MSVLVDRIVGRRHDLKTRLSGLGEWDDWLYVFKLALGGWLTHFGKPTRNHRDLPQKSKHCHYSAVLDHGASDIPASLREC